MASSPISTIVFFDLGNTLTFFNSASQRKAFPDALDTLQILHERGYRLGLLSNQLSTATVNQVYDLLSQFGFDTYIDRELVTISSEIARNRGKPHQPIFDLALQKGGHEAGSSQSIFITETSSHIAAARGFGWRGILKRNSGTCRSTDGECVRNLAGLLDRLPSLVDTRGTNLHLAPPVTRVDGFVSVPIDIDHINVKLTFDGATSMGTGDATFEFKMGLQTGYPIFDLRQTITAAWLDGISISPSQLEHHDFGGGPNAQMRIIESNLPASSTHTLRVIYDLAHPQASTAGSYQPQLTWTNGPRLTFNFGFTDLGAGRYLESWIPANLIYDQFELHLEMEILHSAIQHSVISNGKVTSIGNNHWAIDFPKRFTAFSPLLELRATETLTSLSDTITLPVSGSTVTIEIWKLTTNSANIATALNNIKGWLTDNENDIGRYVHNNRFVAFLNIGGMEYEGGTTSGSGPLQHETFHSWWGRGIKPATQPDAWFDEAWTTYHDAGASSSLPFDFSDSPVTLRTDNPWVRVTSSGSYSLGKRFFDGLASLLGVSTLQSLMRDFYTQRRSHLVTTTDLEEFLLCRTGNATIVDAFHHFIYGFPPPSPVPDLWIQDDPGHTGGNTWGGAFWNSPDLWVRNQNDGGLTHQNPEYGQDNWFYVRVRNRSTTATALHFVVTFNVKTFAGTEFVFPEDFLPCVASKSGFYLGPGESRIVRARWPRNKVPAAGTHACWLATVISRMDHPSSRTHVWTHNNLAQKNLTVVDLHPNKWFVLPFVVANLHSRFSKKFRLELVRPKGQASFEATLLSRNGIVFKKSDRLRVKKRVPPVNPLFNATDKLCDCGSLIPDIHENSSDLFTSLSPDTLLGTQLANAVEKKFHKGHIARLPITLPRQDQTVMGLRLQVPKKARKGETLKFDLLKRDGKTNRILGGLAIELRVR